MKSGSTWVSNIIGSHGKWKPIANKYKNPNWSNPSILPDNLDDLLSEKEYYNNNWYAKQHWRGKQKYSNLLNDKHIKIINIVRNLRDVLVSRYFHELRLGQTKAQSVNSFYFEHEGKTKMKEYLSYHAFWHGPSLEKQPWLCVYESLLLDFNTEAKGLFNFLGEPISEEEIERIKVINSFNNKAVTGKGEFYRKGIAGDWENHLSSELIADLETLMLDCNYPHQKLQASFQ